MVPKRRSLRDVQSRDPRPNLNFHMTNNSANYAVAGYYNRNVYDIPNGGSVFQSTGTDYGGQHGDGGYMSHVVYGSIDPYGSQTKFSSSKFHGKCQEKPTSSGSK